MDSWWWIYNWKCWLVRLQYFFRILLFVSGVVCSLFPVLYAVCLVTVISKNKIYFFPSKHFVTRNLFLLQKIMMNYALNCLADFKYL